MLNLAVNFKHRHEMAFLNLLNIEICHLKDYHIIYRLQKLLLHIK